MRALGEFGEFAGWPRESPSIQSTIQPSTLGVDQRRTALYLAQGSFVLHVMEMVPDVLDGEPVFLSGSLQSDGDWFWRQDLAHYVLKYNLRLPDDFVEHATRFQWAPGTLVDDDLASAVLEVREYLHRG